MCHNTLPFHHAFTIGFSVQSLIYIVHNGELVLLTLRRSQRRIAQRHLAALTGFQSPFFFNSFVPLFFIRSLMCLLSTVPSTRGAVTALHTLSLLHSRYVHRCRRAHTGDRDISTARAYAQPLLQRARFIYIILKAFSVEITIASCYKMEKSCKVIFEIAPAEPMHVKELCFFAVRRTQSATASVAQSSE